MDPCVTVRGMECPYKIIKIKGSYIEGPDECDAIDDQLLYNRGWVTSRHHYSGASGDG